MFAPMFRFTIREVLGSDAGDEIDPHKLFALSCGCQWRGPPGKASLLLDVEQLSKMRAPLRAHFKRPADIRPELIIAAASCRRVQPCTEPVHRVNSCQVGIARYRWCGKQP